MADKEAKKMLHTNLEKLIAKETVTWLTQPAGTILVSANDEAMVLFVTALLTDMLGLSRLPGLPAAAHYIKSVNDLCGNLNSDDIDALLNRLVEDRKRVKLMKPLAHLASNL